MSKLNIFKKSKESFQQHLNIDQNERIIFSGKFGSGKTTFIKDFFREDEHTSKDYNTVHIYPVNYSVATNEDIFQYIKSDILYDLLLNYGNKIKVDQSKVSELIILKEFMGKNAFSAFAGLGKFTPYGDGVEALNHLLEKYKAFRTKVSKSNDDHVADFMEEIKHLKSSLYEEDLITIQIKELLAALKKKTKKQNVLIIDDVDRIDPEHIFRILNVFAAHYDQYEEKGTNNKFGFDKIILVCDIQNITNIFSAKYGGDTDFDGYIDKFYSRKIYHFDINEDLYRSISSIIKLAIDPVSIATPNNVITIKEAIEDPAFSYLLASFAKHELLSIRKVRKFFTQTSISTTNFNIPVRFDYPDNNTHLFISVETYPVLIMVEILVRIFGSYNNLLNAVQTIGSKGHTISKHKPRLIELFAVIQCHSTHRFGTNVSLPAIDSLVIDGGPVPFIYRMENDKIIYQIENQINDLPINIFNMFEKVLKILHKNKYLK